MTILNFFFELVSIKKIKIKKITSKDAKIMDLIEGTDLQSFLLKHELELEQMRKTHESDREKIRSEVELDQKKFFLFLLSFYFIFFVLCFCERGGKLIFISSKYKNKRFIHHLQREVSSKVTIYFLCTCCFNFFILFYLKEMCTN